ncbi:hypothetical protein ACFL1N_17690 [Thermodesulfobacteriota bacterium]
MNENHWNIKKEDYFGQLKYRGDICVLEPMAFLIKVYDQNGFNYTKVSMSDVLVHEVDCLFHPVLPDGIQVIFRIDHSANSKTTWHNKTFEVHEHGSFTEGHLFTLAHFDDSQPAIDILGISTTKLRNLRNGIWRVKKEYIESIPEPNKEILLKSRHGYVRTNMSNDFNIIRERIKQIEKKALKKLRDNLPDDVA